MAELYKYATAVHLYKPIVKRGVTDFAVGADWTPAAGDVKISIDGGAAANVTNLPTAITMGNGAIWDFSLVSGELTGKKIRITVVDAATKAVEDTAFEIDTYGHASAQHVIDLTDGVRAGLTALPNAAAEAAGGLYTRGTGAGQINQPANGKVDSYLAGILTTALTETSSGYLATGMKTLLDVAAPVLTLASVNQTGDGYARLGAPAGASHAADVAAVKVDTAVIKAKTDQLTFTTPSVVDSSATVSSAAIRSAVGLASANLDTQLGAIDDYLDTEITAIKAKTDQLAFTVAGHLDVNVRYRTDLAELPRVQGVARAGSSASTMKLAAGTTIGECNVGTVIRMVDGVAAGDSIQVKTLADPAGADPIATALTNQAWQTATPEEGDTYELIPGSGWAPAQPGDLLGTPVPEPGEALDWDSATLLSVLAWLAALSSNRALTDKATGVSTLRNAADDADVAASTASDNGVTFERGAWGPA